MKVKKIDVIIYYIYYIYILMDYIINYFNSFISYFIIPTTNNDIINNEPLDSMNTYKYICQIEKDKFIKEENSYTPVVIADNIYNKKYKKNNIK